MRQTPLAVQEAGLPVRWHVDWPRLCLLAPLVLLSWWSTTQGLLGLVAQGQGRPNAFTTLSISAAVLILTCLMSWTVGVLQNRRGGKLMPAYLFGYGLLATISVGFGFGFYWTQIESRAAALAEVKAEIEQTKGTFDLAFSRLDETLAALAFVAELSEQRAQEEATVGGTCAVGSAAGNGPRFRLRKRDAATLAAAHSQVRHAVGGDATSVGSLTARRAVIDDRLTQFASAATLSDTDDLARRQLDGVRRDLNALVAAYEAFRTGPVVASVATTLAQRARVGEGDMQDGASIFRCDDPLLQTTLDAAANGLATLPPMPPISLQVPVGAEATVAAFHKLTNTFVNFAGWRWSEAKIDAAYEACIGTSAISALCTEEYGRRMAGLNRLAGRDFIPLLVAIAVDLFIFLLSSEPFRRERVALAPSGRKAGAGLAQLLTRLKTPEQQFLSVLLEHTVWHRGAYYLAMPVGGAGEVGLSHVEHSLSLLGVVLADMGLTTPAPGAVADALLRKSLARRFGRVRSRTIRQSYDVYRLEPGALNAIAMQLIGMSDEQPVKVPEPAEKAARAKSHDWRFNLSQSRERAQEAPPAAPVRYDTESLLHRLTDPSPIGFGEKDGALARWMRAAVK